MHDVGQDAVCEKVRNLLAGQACRVDLRMLYQLPLLVVVSETRRHRGHLDHLVDEHEQA